MSSLRLVLVGKTGAGKSSAGNTILGKKEFKACLHFNSVTTECQKGEGEVDGSTVIVVDTPGIADLKVSVEEAKDRVAECFSMCAPGPHAFLLVLKLGRFTSEEKRAAEVIQEVFGEAALKHTMVLFTNGDELEDPDHLDTLLSGCEELTYLLDTINHRYHVFNNKVDDHTQVTQLLNKIDQMVGKRGRHYTSELFQKAEEKRKEEQEKERVRKEMEDLREEWYEKPELRILLIGNTKASIRTASKLILEERFQHVDNKGCQKTNGEVYGRRVSVVETPGLSDMHTKSAKEIMKEILSCICLSSPGPHAFVIVEESREESANSDGTMELIKDVFGVKAQNYVIVLGIQSSKKPVQSSAEHSPLLEHHRHTFEYPVSHRQVTSLLQKIDKRVEKNGGSFTSEMYSVAERVIREEQENILKSKKQIYEQMGKEVTENDYEWQKELIGARKKAEYNNSLRNDRAIALCATVCGTAGALIGAAIGAVAGGSAGAAVGGAIGTAGAGPVGAVAGVPAGAAVGAQAGAVVGANKGAMAGAALAIGIAGVVAGRKVGAAYQYELRKSCNMQ